MAFNREQAIQGALDMGQSVNEINAGLQSIGQKPLSGYEQSLIQHNNYGTNILDRAGINAKNIAQGLGTILAAPWQYANNPEFRGAVNRTVSDYGRRFMRGETNPIEDMANMMLLPYDTNINQILTDPKQAGQNIIYGAANNPLDATLDILSIVPTGAVASALSKVPNEPFQVARRAIMPTNRERQINTLLNVGDLNSAARRARFEEDIAKITTDPNLEKSVIDLTTGSITPGIKESRDRIKSFTDRMNQQMVDLGVDVGEAKKVAVGQFVLENLDPRRDKQIYLQNVQKAIDSPTVDNLKAIGLDKASDLTKLVEDGSKAFDEGRIFPITQRGIVGGYNQSLVDLTDVGAGITRERTYGIATPAQVARNFDRGYRNLYSIIERAQNSKTTLEELATKFGRKATPDELTKIRRNEIIISPTEFKDGVSTLFGKENRGNLRKIAGDLEKGATPNTLNKYANDLYVVNKSDLKAFTNYAKGVDYESGLGRFIQSSKPVMGAFKSNVLARPSYIAGNVLGNLSLGAIGGADFITALKPGMIERYVPDYIKQSTSFHGYDAVSTNNPIIAYRDSANRLRNAYKDLSDPKTSTSEKIAASGEIFKRSQELALPLRQIFQANNQAELIARSAVYFNEAKKLAKETSQTMENVLDKALTNNELQRTLIDRVNSVLGDYVGRNYFIDPTLREAASTVSPFYKVITTSADVALQQARRNPFRLQAYARIPSRIGNEIQRVDRELGYQPSDNDPRGGMVVTPTYSRRYPATVLYNNYQPFSAPLEIVQSILGPAARQGEGTGLAGIGSIFEGNITPLVGLANILSGKDMYGNPVVGPNSYKLGNQVITLDNNGNRLQQPDILGAAVGYIGRYFSPAATLYNSTIGPLLGGASGRGFMQPTNRSIFGQVGGFGSIPYLMEGRPDRLRYKNPEEAIREQLGIRQRDVYFPMRNQISPYDIRQINRRRFMTEQRLMR